MAHPERAQYIPYLQEKLGKDIAVVYDEKNNIWDTCRRAWLAHDPEAEYHVVIQDDAIVCNNFRELAEARLTRDCVYSFYAGKLLKTQIDIARRNKKDYVFNSFIFNEIALCMKTEHIADMVKFCDEKMADTDQQIGKWAAKNRKGIIYTIPSLIDHRDEESLFYRNYKKPQNLKTRKAYLFHE